MIHGRTSAAVLMKAGEVVLREFELPRIGSDDGLIRVEACGVCGADWGPYTGDFFNGYFTPPLILGHEIVGLVEGIGADAARRHGVGAGDRVVVEEAIPCGSCRHCRDGRYLMCPAPKYGARTIDDSPSLWGGYSQYLYLHPRAMVHRVPEGVSTEQAPLFIPISNGIYWVREVGDAAIGSTVLVLGPGQHGLGCVIGAREAGAGTVIVLGLERDVRRLELARALGADHTVVVDDSSADPLEHVAELTDGRLADVVVNATEAAGEAFKLATEVAGDGATVVNVGSSHGLTTGFEPDIVWMKELTIKGVRGRYGSVTAALEIIRSGKYPLERLATHTYPLEETERALLTLGGRGDPDPVHINVDPWL